MFTGTLRFNIDPEEKATDEEILSLIERAGLAHLTTREGKKNQDSSKNLLNLEIEEGGENLSTGEKSLICICRAVLRKNKIVILDEATANIDLINEQKIQRIISEEFKHCTVLTIAHRLQTIIDSDQILVLSKGKTAEYDAPQNLLKNKDSHFTKLVNEMKKAGQNIS